MKNDNKMVAKKIKNQACYPIEKKPSHYDCFMGMKIIGKMTKKEAKSRQAKRQGKKQANMHNSMEKITLTRGIKYIPMSGRFN